MKVRTVTIDMEQLGAELANADSEEQAALFRGMARELRHWPSEHKKQTQFCLVSDHLSEDDKQELNKCLEMIWWKEDSK